MEPTTIRLSDKLQRELDKEAQHYGYQSRSEYIRYLLNRRELIHQEMIEPSSPIDEGKQNQVNNRVLEETQSRLAKLEEEINQLKSPTNSELDKEGPLEASSDQMDQSLPDSESDENRESEDTLPTLKRWLSDDGNGPNKDYAQNILLEAMTLLDESGPLQKKELLNKLYSGEDDPYKNKNALWRSTVDEHYGDIPGFTRPQKGRYNFNKKIFLEEIDLPANISQWD